MARSRFGARRLGVQLTLLALVSLALWIGNHVPWLAAEAPQASEPWSAPSVPASSDQPPTPVPPRRLPTPREPRVMLDRQSVWSSRAACEAAIEAVTSRPRTDRLRVASWNLHWFPDGRADQTSHAGGTDVAWMACAMASLRADVIAVQEVVTHLRGRRALAAICERLNQLTGGQWRFDGDECPDDRRQHVGFLHDTNRVTLQRLRSIPELNPYGSACAKRLRPGVVTRLRHGATDLDLITLHLDSGNEPRDYTHRLHSVRRLTELFVGRPTPVLAMGDFNTMGCDACVPSTTPDAEAIWLEATLRQSAYRSVATAQPVCSEHFNGRSQLLDRAITTLPAERVTFEMAGICAELSCKPPRTTSEALARLSDHCPIVVEIATTP